MAVVSFFLTLSLVVGSSQNVDATFKHSLGNLAYGSFTTNAFHAQLANNELPISEATSITIFTHGMSSGNAGADWYTVDNGIYSGLPFDISNYVFEFNEDDGVPSLLALGQTPVNGEWLVPASSHLCLVYNAGENDAGNVRANTYLYSRFEKRVDRFLMAYYDIFHIVPKINLIGHSRGGLINMMYAIDHPYLVSNLLSVGTPYVGSDWAKALCYLQHLENDATYQSPYDEVAGTSFSEQYADAWNDVATEYDINTLAVGFTISTGIIETPFRSALYALYPAAAEWLLSYLGNWIVEVTWDAWTSFVDLVLDCLMGSAAAAAYGMLGGVFNTLAFSMDVASFFTGNSSYSQLASILHYVFDLISEDLFDAAWNNDGVIGTDLCVEISSQIGMDRDDNQVFDLDNALWVADSPSDYGDPSRPGLLSWVPHNHEAKNPLVCQDFADELEEDPSYLHSHDFSLRTTSNRHVLDCDCGAVFHDCHGPYTRQPVNTLQHLESCTACDFARIRPHSWAYTYNQNGHHAHCQECDISLSFQPHDYVCRDMNANQHMYTCVCGRGYTGPHFFANGRCRECNRLQGSGGGIMPL